MKTINRSSNYSNRNTQTFKISSRSFDSLNLQTFPDYSLLRQYSSLSFCHNPITSLSSLPSLPELTSLKLDHTKISTFDGAKYQPQLSSISMQSTPITTSKYFFEMCLIAFGTQITRINEKNITYKQRKFAQENENTLHKYIVTGWLITKGSQPIHLLNYQTRKRVSLYTVNPKEKQDANSFDQKKVSETDTDINSISKSTTNDPSSRSFSYASSFVSTSSDTRSKSTSIENNSYNLDKEARDALLQKMLKLTQKWNPAPKVTTSDKDKDNFFDNNIFLLFQPSLARSRRLVTRDHRTENIFRLPVSFKSDSPFAQENKPYLLRKREEHEMRIKQKRDQMLREQEQYEYEYEEEEEEIPEEEKLESEEKIKNENENQLKSDLQEEVAAENNILTDKNNIQNVDDNQNQEEEEKVQIASFEPQNQEEASIQTEQYESKTDETQKELEIIPATQNEFENNTTDNDKKFEFPKIQVSFKETKHLIRKSLASKEISTPSPTKSRRSLPRSNSERIMNEPGPETNNSPSLTESEMEIYRKRRLSSMNKFILNPNTPVHSTKDKNETTNMNTSLTPDEKILKKKRRTLTHSKSFKHYNKDDTDNNLNTDSNPNLINDFNPQSSQNLNNNSNSTSSPNLNQKPLDNNNKKVRLLTRRPTYSEILSDKYKQKRKLDLLSIQSKQNDSTNQKAPTSQEPTRKFDLSKRKTSFVGISEINNFRKKESKTDTDTDIENTSVIDIGTISEAQNKKQNSEIETKNEAQNKTETFKEEEELNTNKLPEKPDILNDTEEEEEEATVSKNDDNFDNGGLLKDEDEAKSESKEQTAPDIDDAIAVDDYVDDENNQLAQEDKEDDQKDKDDENEDPDLDLLDEMLKDVDIEDDTDENEANLRYAAFQECIEKHPDKEEDDDFVSEYIEQYLKNHLNK
ncbi:hypothetical protein M9Y10_005163 [Tritrichomonas musculus]|uniref:Uncharacterized protein n=1 Tax=Tritrichomonas musculus TaxID=1915356 RepID=A0ABR2JMS5_9EUKA